MLHSLSTSFFRKLKSIVCQRVLQASADRVTWNEDWRTVIIRWVCINICGGLMTSLKSCSLATYPVQVVLLTVGKEFK